MTAVQFEVAYRFDEYRGFVIEHGGALTGKPYGLLARVFVTLVVLPVFLYKVSRVGRCTFTFDTEGITRVSKIGETKTAWSEVVAVHKYKPGLLIEKRKGALPIPYRCFTGQQRASLEAMVSDWKAASSKEKGDV